MTQRIDEQTIELLGVSYVRMQLQRDGVEVAEPARDRGIDLIGYLDKNEDAFYARPIQVKASLKTRWVHHSKYAHFPGLVIAHVMNLEDPANTIVFALTYDENHAVAKDLGYLRRDTLWRSPDRNAKRLYKQPISQALADALAPYRIREGGWRRLLERSRLSSRSR